MDTSIEENLPEEEDTNVYLKSIKLASEEDVEKVSKELRKGNLLVVNLSGLFSEKGKLRIVIEKVKGVVEETEGDICRVSKEKLLLVPKGMEIVA